MSEHANRVGSISGVGAIGAIDGIDGIDGELARERAHVARCREALRAQVEDAGYQVIAGEDVSGDGAGAEDLGRYLRTRARRMAELPDSPAFFGRLDFGDGPEAGDHRGQRYHLGRRRISEDPTAPPLVVDWRAPVARAFYRASAKDPYGLARRRRFGWAPAALGMPEELTGLEDEPLDRPAHRAAPGGLLITEIERPRTGPMRDIVATIQPEQDELVRGEPTESVCVQGAPGSGKTAVGLHRAAYLLYTHPQRLRRGGLLVIGPNRTFLHHIAEVLPSLGEANVAQCTVEELVEGLVEGHEGHEGHEVRAEDGEAAAALKQDARMAEVLRRALLARVRVEGAEPVVVPEGSYQWRLPGGLLDRLTEEVRDQGAPYAIGRENLRTRVMTALRDRAERRSGVTSGAWQARIARSRPVREFLDAAWPAVRPAQVVAELLGDGAVLARAARGLLDGQEQAALLWARPPRSWKSARWSRGDLMLLDEVAGLIERPPGFGHVVVDEAQDLSPMQCRAIARRSGFGSLTVLGDLAQATTPWSARNWPEQLAHLGKPDASVVALSTGFRVPAAVTDLTNRLLAALAVDVPPAVSLRRDGEVRIRAIDGSGDAPVAAVRRALEREGSVAVITADAAAEPTAATLRAAGIALEPEEGARVTVLPAALAKGLEYDHVIVLEPAAIVEAEERGLHRLYVVLTRAVSRLDVLHARPLPLSLGRV
ncbi:HelD family protein [Kitasatospora sp. NPDC051170]|uniref:HelD family protein n=1 Tax=Kitasatospora sp. NPDC051170 TaxID=3364056 RepID=UPI0037A575B0